jgi:hypothetical protein
MSRAACSRTTIARRSISTALALLMMAGSPLLLSATYRWVDAKGVVHYSDRPQPGAEKVQLPPAQTYTNDRASSNAASAAESVPPVVAATAAAQEMLAAGECMITSPQDEQTYNNASSVMIAAKGPTGGEIRLMLDGGVVQKGISPEFLVNPIDRGMHRALVIFMTQGGGEQCRTKPVTFYIRKPSVLRPPQARPRPKP